jgi:ribosomal protein L11 methyltransferase
MNSNDETLRLKERILETISVSEEPLTFGKLVMISDIERKILKKVLEDLIAAGELTYTYRHGCSFIEKSFAKPVRVSDHVVLVPYGMSFSGNPGDVVIKMRQGVSFGSGDHPTTRLALRGIDRAFHGSGKLKDKNNGMALDIGTGSGVLAIACILFGASKAIGIDTDPCAIKESRENAEINGLGGRIEIPDMPVEKIEGKFSAITANLRYPTLINLRPVMIDLTEKNSILILSGIKVSEAEELTGFYLKKYFKCLWIEKEKNWTGFLFQRT